MKHLSIRNIALLALPLGLLSPAHGQEKLTAEEATVEALRANPELHAARLLVEEAEGRLRQAGLWPNPELQLFARDGRLTGGPDAREYSVEIAQRFPLAGRLRRARDVGRVDVALAFEEIRNQERLVAGQVRLAFADVLVEQEQLTLQQGFLEAQKEFLAVGRQRMDAGEVSILDVNQAEVDVERTRQEIRRRETRLQRRKSDLHYLMGREGRPVWQASGTVDAFAADLERLRVERPLVRRPDLEILALQADRAQAEVALARSEAWGDVTVGLEVERETERTLARRERETFVGVSVSVPLPVFDRRQGDVSASRAARARSLLEGEALRLRIATQRASIEEQLETLEDLRTAGEEVLVPRLERNAAILAQAYAEGQVSMTDLLQMQDRLYRLATERLDVTADFARALVEMETLIGASPHLTRPIRRD